MKLSICFPSIEQGELLSKKQVEPKLTKQEGLALRGSYGQEVHFDFMQLFCNLLAS